jgi:hypothetical protein
MSKLCRLCLSIEKKIVIVKFQSIKQQCHQVYQIEHVHYIWVDQLCVT